MKTIKFHFLPIIFFLLIIISCSEKSTNQPEEELNDITNPPGIYLYKLVINSSGDFFSASRPYLSISTDRGTSWDTLVNPIVEDVYITSNDYIFISRIITNANVLFRSSDSGNSWTPVLTRYLQLILTKEDQDGNIYAYGENLVKSSDSGNSWEAIYYSDVREVCIPNNSTIVIGVPGTSTLTGQIVYSTNNGINWDSTGYNVNVREFYLYGSLIFAGGRIHNEVGGGVHKSSDNGVTWTSCGLEQTTVSSFVTDNQQRLFIGTSKGIYFTADEGEAWQNVLPDSSVTTLMNDKKGFLYAGTTNGTFLRSTDNGRSWHN